MTGGFNPKGYKGKYSGKAGRNTYRNPQPAFGGSGGGGGKKGCPLFAVQVIAGGGLYIALITDGLTRLWS